jgi:hypothetical protein
VKHRAALRHFLLPAPVKKALRLPARARDLNKPLFKANNKFDFIALSPAMGRGTAWQPLPPDAQ